MQSNGKYIYLAAVSISVLQRLYQLNIIAAGII